MDLAHSVLTVRRTVFIGDDGQLHEKDTKTHQQRRIVLDPETAAVLEEHQARVHGRSAVLGVRLDVDAFVFSPEPDGLLPMNPDTATQRYQRMATRLGIKTTLKNLRHYTATELISGGVDVRTVAGRLGHGGGGSTTLRVYAAWTSEADQRAARTVSGRMPARPRSDSGMPVENQSPGPHADMAAAPLHLKITGDLRGAIESGVLRPGDVLPTVKELAARYQVAASTAHRTIAALVEARLCEASRGKRATVAEPKPTNR